jgi:hypothetical protein
MEIAAAPLSARFAAFGKIVDDCQADRIAQAIQHDRQLDLLTGGMMRGAAHAIDHKRVVLMFNTY